MTRGKRAGELGGSGGPRSDSGEMGERESCARFFEIVSQVDLFFFSSLFVTGPLGKSGRYAPPESSSQLVESR
jgi:hypothetical protein